MTDVAVKTAQLVDLQRQSPLAHLITLPEFVSAQITAALISAFYPDAILNGTAALHIEYAELIALITSILRG